MGITYMMQMNPLIAPIIVEEGAAWGSGTQFAYHEAREYFAEILGTSVYSTTCSGFAMEEISIFEFCARNDLCIPLSLSAGIVVIVHIFCLDNVTVLNHKLRRFV